MEKNLKLYDGAKIIKCEINDEVVIGQDSFVSHNKLAFYLPTLPPLWQFNGSVGR